MCQVPLFCPGVGSTSKVWTDAPGAQHMGVVHATLPGQGRRAEALHVSCGVAHLLRVTVGTALSGIDVAAALFRCRECQRRTRGQGQAFIGQGLPGNDAEQGYREHEEANTCH